MRRSMDHWTLEDVVKQRVLLSSLPKAVAASRADLAARFVPLILSCCTYRDRQKSGPQVDRFPLFLCERGRGKRIGEGREGKRGAINEREFRPPASPSPSGFDRLREIGGSAASKSSSLVLHCQALGAPNPFTSIVSSSSPRRRLLLLLLLALVRNALIRVCIWVIWPLLNQSPS